MPILDVARDTSPARPVSAETESESRAAGAAAAITEGHPLTGAVAIDNPVAELKCLKEQAAKLRQHKKELARQLRNAQRKRKRLKEKPKQLSCNDLLSVMLMRQEKKARLETAAEAAAAANGTSNASQTAKQRGPQSGPTEEFNREQQTAS
jgi:hypothetical protein